jgi:hypothetical protein
MNASQYSLSDLVGRHVRSLAEFSGIPVGTIGTVDEHYKIGPKHEGVMVKWTTASGSVVRDGFGRDDEFDETTYLDVI